MMTKDLLFVEYYTEERRLFRSLRKQGTEQKTPSINDGALR
jgi:hypothetical protein